MVTTHDESGTLLHKRSSQRSAKDKAGPISDLLLKLVDNILAVKIQLLLLVNEYRHDAKAYLTGRHVNSPKWIPPGGCCSPASPTVPELKSIVFLVNFPHQSSRGHQRNTVPNCEACKPAGTPSKAYSPEMGQERFAVTRSCFEVFLKLILFFQAFVRLSKTKFINIVYWGHVSGWTKVIIKLWNALQKKSGLCLAPTLSL